MPDRPTHLHEREGDGKRNTLLGWPYIVNSSPCSYHGLLYGHAMFIGNSQKEARYLAFPFSSLPGLSLARFKITADILIAFAGEFFTEEIADTESL